MIDFFQFYCNHFLIQCESVVFLTVVDHYGNYCSRAGSAQGFSLINSLLTNQTKPPKGASHFCFFILSSRSHMTQPLPLKTLQFLPCVLLPSLCTQDDSPGTFQSCVMLRDCQMSEWSSWSPCSKTCRAADLSPGYRLRSRTITQPAIGRGKECPALEEKEACNIIGDLLPRCPR